MITVAIDTSADVCVAVAADDRVVSRTLADRRAHAEQCLPLLVAAATELGVSLPDVTDVVVGMGPGPFTGLRVGITAGFTLAATVGAQLHRVCSLDVVAAQWVACGDAPDEFIVVADARRKEVYWAKYDATGKRIGEPQVSAPSEVPQLPLAGSGAELVGTLAGPTTLDPAIMAKLCGQLPDVGAEPLYLRRPDAEVSTKRKSTLVRRLR